MGDPVVRHPDGQATVGQRRYTSPTPCRRGQRLGAASWIRTGFGTVYKGTWQRVPVAIKARNTWRTRQLRIFDKARRGIRHVVQVIKPPEGKPMSKAAQQALLQEAQIHFRLKHPR
jgi:hypothetical protein